MAWSYTIYWGSQIVGTSQKFFENSNSAEVEALLDIQKMSKMSGCQYSYRVYLDTLSL